MRPITPEETVSKIVNHIRELMLPIADKYVSNHPDEKMYTYYIARNTDGTYTVYPKNVQGKCTLFICRKAPPSIFADILYTKYTDILYAPSRIEDAKKNVS